MSTVPSGICSDHPMLHNLYLCRLFHLVSVQTIPCYIIYIFNSKIVERGKMDTPHTQIHDLWPLTHKYMTSDPSHTNTWPLTFLAWYRYFNKKWRGSISFMRPKVCCCFCFVFVLCFVYLMLPVSPDFPFLMSPFRYSLTFKKFYGANLHLSVKSEICLLFAYLFLKYEFWQGPGWLNELGSWIT